MERGRRPHPMQIFGVLAMIAIVVTVIASDETPPSFEGEGLAVTIALGGLRRRPGDVGAVGRHPGPAADPRPGDDRRRQLRVRRAAARRGRIRRDLLRRGRLRRTPGTPPRRPAERPEPARRDRLLRALARGRRRPTSSGCCSPSRRGSSSCGCCARCIGAARRPRRWSRSCASRVPPTPSRQRWPSAAGWPATCTTCSRTRCRRWRCSSRARGCSRATATPTPRSSRRSSARTTSRPTAWTRRAPRSARCAATRCRARSGCGCSRTASATAPGCPSRASRARSPPTRGWRSTAPPRRR